MTRIHSLVVTDHSTGETLSCSAQSPDRVVDGLAALEEADVVIGHNILKFDIPAIKKLYPDFTVKGKAFDTLVASRVTWPDIKPMDFKFSRSNPLFPKKLIGKHSLEAWGYRLKEWKGDYQEEMQKKGLDPWAAWNQEMQDYCEQDVVVTSKLYQKILDKTVSAECMQLEHDFAEVLLRQEQVGVGFDYTTAEILYCSLLEEREKIEADLREAFPPFYTRKLKKHKRGGTKFNGKEDVVVKDEEPFWFYTLTDFNPGSSKHVARVLMDRGWKPSDKTDSGAWETGEKILKTIKGIPEVEGLIRHKLVSKRLSMLKGKGNKGLLSFCKEGRIHGAVNTNGALTGRCTHAMPNCAQIPKVKGGKEGPLKGSEGAWGWDFRSLFVPRKGWKMIGADGSGLELRCLAHYMARYDKGEYARILLEEDIHTVNQNAAGLPTRDNAKTFIYGFLYGAGDAKIGEIVNGTAKDGKRLKTKFLAGLPALHKLISAIQEAVEKKGYLVGLDGRILPIRSSHAALNTLLQSAGAVIMKKATVLADRKLKEKGLKWNVDFAQMLHVHDEFQYECKPEYEHLVKETLVEAIRDAGAHFKFRCPIDGEAKSGSSWADTH